ncbi:MAG: hypothetical protein ACR2N1_08540 [Rubripirellula sp.]
MKNNFPASRDLMQPVRDFPAERSFAGFEAWPPPLLKQPFG